MTITDFADKNSSVEVDRCPVVNYTKYKNVDGAHAGAQGQTKAYATSHAAVRMWPRTLATSLEVSEAWEVLISREALLGSRNAEFGSNQYSGLDPRSYKRKKIR